jgi:hypothetical protein
MHAMPGHTVHILIRLQLCLMIMCLRQFISVAIARTAHVFAMTLQVPVDEMSPDDVHVHKVYDALHECK